MALVVATFALSPLAAVADPAVRSSTSSPVSAGESAGSESEARLLERVRVLEHLLADAEARIVVLEKTLGHLDAAAKELTVSVQAIETKTDCLSAADDDLFFTGCNVHIQNGSGYTDSPPNGLGNLIIGYNESTVVGAMRTGSHNLVIGTEHSYSSFGGIVGGLYNTISAPYASVTGGAFNTASMSRSTVAGGEHNTASGVGATVSGGVDNTANGEDAAVCGGFDNVANARAATVSGGSMNAATGESASVSGGSGNTASARYAAIGGGELNRADAVHASVSGGAQNVASGTHASISRGIGLVAKGAASPPDETVVRTVASEVLNDSSATALVEWNGVRAAEIDELSRTRKRSYRVDAPGIGRSGFEADAGTPFKLEGRPFGAGSLSPFVE